MLLQELQRVLDLVVLSLEAEDFALGTHTAAHHLQEALSALSYARPSAAAELDEPAACLVDEVLSGLTGTISAKLQGLNLPANAHTSAQGAQQNALQQKLQQRGAYKQQDRAAGTSHAACTFVPGSTGPAGAQPDTSNDSHQLQFDQQFAMGEVGDVDDAAGSTAAAESVDIIHNCLRTVCGTLADVSGLEDVKRELIESVLWPLKFPTLFKGYRKPAKSFLFAGPPGTGKTMLIEKLAAESGMVLLALTPSTCLSKWSGESEKTIKSVFAAACSMQPSIVFIDEIDALAGQRSAGDDAASRRLLTELLLQMTAAVSQEALYIFACTNRIQDCDAALLRRFERRIFVPLPDGSARHAFFTSALQRPEMAHCLTPGDIAALVTATEGYSCSDLANVCKNACMLPVREFLAMQMGVSEVANTRDQGSSGVPWVDQHFHSQEPSLANPRALCSADFLAALRLIKPTSEDQHTYALP